MARLAFNTIGILKEPMGHPEVQGFMDRLESVFGAAEGSSGFVDRSRRDYETMEHAWGDVVIAPCFGSVDDLRRLPTTLSLWEDLESVAAYAYHGAHGEAMGIRREWFLEHANPTYVAWWVEDDHVPTFAEAAERLQRLHEQGPTPFAFNFKTAFAPDGSAEPLDAAKVRAKIAANAL